MKMLELQNESHQQSIHLGLWDEPKTDGFLFSLIHSELSKMVINQANDLPKHLKDHGDHWVACAEFIIKSLDYLGAFGFSEWDGVIDAYNEDHPAWTSDYDEITSFVSEVHAAVSYSYLSKDDSIQFNLLACSILMAWCFAISQGVDIEQIIKEKLEYNISIISK